MAQQTNLEKIKFLIAHAKQDINLCAVAYRIIEKASAEEQPILLEAFIRGYRYTRTDRSLKEEIPVVFSDEIKTAYLRRYQRIVDGHLEEFLNAGYGKEEFYTELVHYIIHDKNLLDDGARAFAIFDCCIDKRLPYADVDLTSGVKMEKDEYSMYVEQLEDNIERVTYILNANLQQKTEQASLVLEELDKCDDVKKKTVLLATVFERYEVEAMRIAHLRAMLSANPSLIDSFPDD